MASRSEVARRRRRRAKRRKKRLLRAVIIILILAIFVGAGIVGYQFLSGQYVKKGTELLQAGKYEQAIQEFQTSVDKGKKEEEAYRGIGMASWEMKDYKTVISSLEQVLKLSGKPEAVTYNLLACAQMKEKDYGSAIENFRQGTQAGDGSEKLIKEMKFNIIVCMEKKQDYEAARKELKAYLSAYPDDKAAKKEAEFLKTQ